MFPIDLWHLFASILPHVRSPWPESIGIEFPFAMAGGWSMLAGIFNAELPQAQHDRVVNRAGVHGFGFGALFYALSLLLQVASGL
jgi:hypothetical protein